MVLPGLKPQNIPVFKTTFGEPQEVWLSISDRAFQIKLLKIYSKHLCHFSLLWGYKILFRPTTGDKNGKYYQVLNNGNNVQRNKPQKQLLKKTVLDSLGTEKDYNILFVHHSLIPCSCSPLKIYHSIFLHSLATCWTMSYLGRAEMAST